MRFVDGHCYQIFHELVVFSYYNFKKVFAIVKNDFRRCIHNAIFAFLSFFSYMMIILLDFLDDRYNRYIQIRHLFDFSLTRCQTKRIIWFFIILMREEIIKTMTFFFDNVISWNIKLLLDSVSDEITMFFSHKRVCMIKACHFLTSS